MGYVGIDIEGTRRVGAAMTAASAAADEARLQTVGALTLAELDSGAPQQLAAVSDGLSALGVGVIEKADLAAAFTVDPQGVATGLGAPVEELRAALNGLVGFTGPTDLRSVLQGLPPPGADLVLDAALARLAPTLLPALLAGGKPVLDDAQAADLRVLALRLGIQAAGPPGAPAPLQLEQRGFRGFALRGGASAGTGTEVFWQDFWADGRTPEEVLGDPEQLLAWVSGTFELDRRLAVATELPRLPDILASLDFATGADTSVADVVAEVATDFAAIDGWLPEVLAGIPTPAPDAVQVDQTLAFATRVGWQDPGAGAATVDERLVAALVFLRANRALGSALLPTAFEGNAQPLAFFDATGIGRLLDLGRRLGVVTDTGLSGLAAVTDQFAATLGIDLSGTTPLEGAARDESLKQLLGALLSSQVPPAFLATPGLSPRFEAALTHVRAAPDAAQARNRIAEAVAAFRTLAVTGAPALTERQLTAVVGDRVLGVLGRSRLRARGQSAVRKNPEFFLVAAQWGVPGGHKEKLGKHKFTWSFDSTGALAGIKRKKQGFFSRVADTFKAIVSSIGDAFEENPFKAIVQVGKIALGALSIAFPPLAPVALALTVADTVIKAVDGDWLGALSSGLSVFTAGATDLGLGGVVSAVDAAQNALVNSFVNPTLLGFLNNAKRALDIGTTVAAALDADSLAGAIGAGLTAGATVLGNGGQLLHTVGVVGDELTADLVRLGTSLGDLTKVVAPTVGLAAALDRDDLVSAFANGLSVVSAGAGALVNPRGALSSPTPGANTLFEFDKQTTETLAVLAKGTSVTSFVTRAVQAADQGRTADALSYLAQAVTVVQDPKTTVTGDRADIARRIVDVAAIFENAADSDADPSRVGPVGSALVVQRLKLLVDAASTPPVSPIVTTIEPVSGFVTTIQPVDPSSERFVETFGGTNDAGNDELFGGGYDSARAFQPRAQDVVKIVVMGDSFISGEGAITSDGENDYISWGTGAGRLPAQAHQSRSAGAVQAIELLQAQYPDATIRINYSAAGGQTTTLPALAGNGDGPLLDVSFVAQSGATSTSILGRETNHSDDPTAKQIEAVRGADIVLLSVGGNDAEVVDTLGAATFRYWGLGDGVDDIKASADAIGERTSFVPEVLNRVLTEASPTARVLVLGYPNVLASIRPDGTAEPINPGVGWMSQNINPGELQELTKWGATLESTLAGYVATAKPQPEQSVSYLSQWGVWGDPHVLGFPTTAVNDFDFSNFPESYHPNLLGQDRVAATFWMPLQFAVADSLGRPATASTLDLNILMGLGGPTATGVGDSTDNSEISPLFFAGLAQVNPGAIDWEWPDMADLWRSDYSSSDPFGGEPSSEYFDYGDPFADFEHFSDPFDGIDLSMDFSMELF